MDRAFKVIGALGLSISAGALLGMTTPTAMKDAPEPDWRVAARSAHAGKPVELAQTAVTYSSMPEDLSPQIGYGSPDAYQAYYVEAPVRTGYRDVPSYAAKPLAVDTPRSAADACAVDAHDVRGRVEVAANAAPPPDPDTAAAEAEHTPVFDTTGDAPAMDADDVD